MSIVIDASVLVALLADSGPAGTWAEGIVAGAPLLAPALLHVEVANILRRLELSENLTALEASSAHRDLQRLDVEVFPFEPFADRIWALRGNLTSYDAWYVAVAEATDASLATLDQRLVRAPGPTCSFLTA